MAAKVVDDVDDNGGLDHPSHSRSKCSCMKQHNVSKMMMVNAHNVVYYIIYLYYDDDNNGYDDDDDDDDDVMSFKS